MVNAKIDEYQDSKDTKSSLEEKLQRIRRELVTGMIDEEKVTFIMNRVKRITVHKDHLDIELEFIGDIIASIGENKVFHVVNAGKERPGSSRRPKMPYRKNPRRL